MTVRDSTGIDSLRQGADGPAAIPVRPLGIRPDGATVALVSQTAPPLACGECHLWRLPLQLPAPLLAGLEALLCDAERERANAFKVPVPRRHFIATRGVLRLLLARYLQVPATACRFEYGAFGKPVLAEPVDRLRFNVSHSGEQALFAFAEVDIGVDLEWRRAIPDLVPLAAMILSPQQLLRWQHLPTEDRSRALHDAWARKEAVIKAVGAGLSVDLHSLDVGFLPGDPPAVLRVSDLMGPAAAWSLLPLDVGEGYSAAVAARTPGLRAV